MIKTLNGKFGVDAGNISVMDAEYVKANNGMYGETANIMCKKISLEPGEYEVTIAFSAWRGKVNEKVVLETTGEFYIGDAGYYWSSDEEKSSFWNAFLNKTDYLKNMETFKGKCFDTGGDGEFKVKLEFKKIIHNLPMGCCRREAISGYPGIRCSSTRS